MDYLFNINLPEASELQEVLGMVDADFSLEQMFPYIRHATKDLIKLIGEPNYAMAVLSYKNDDVMDEFLMLCRYAVALGAFREYAPLADISYTTQGRAFRSDENMKTAFEWQIDKSDDAMERSYYAALNQIIEFISGSSVYLAPPQIQELKDLCVSGIDVFQQYVDISDSHLLFFKLIPSLKLAERQLIKPRTGAKFPDYRADKDSLIYSLICNICVYFAMADGIQKHSIQLFPETVRSRNVSSSRNVSRFEVDAATLFYKDEMNKLLSQLETAVAKDKLIIRTTRNINFDENDGFVTM